MNNVTFDEWYNTLLASSKRSGIDIGNFNKDYFRVSYERNDTPKGALAYIDTFGEI